MNHNQEPSKEMLGTEIALLNKDQTKETPTSWIGSWLGIIFSGSNASKDSHSPTILQV